MNPDLDSSRLRLACLADASRFRIVLTLLESERCVSDLAASVGLSQSCTTRHLQALQGVGLVRGARDGKRVVFRAEQGARDVFDLLSATLGAEPLEPGRGRPNRMARPAVRRARSAVPSDGAIRDGHSNSGIDPAFSMAIEGDGDMGFESERPDTPGIREEPDHAGNSVDDQAAPPIPRRADLEDFLL